MSPARRKTYRTVDRKCLENPRSEGAESTLTENAASPVPDEPGQPVVRCVKLVFAVAGFMGLRQGEIQGLL